MNFLRKYQVHIMCSILAIFLVYIALGFGSSLFAKGSPNDSVVDVNGEKVPLHIFYSHFDRAMSQVKPGTTLDENAKKQKRDEVIRDLVQQIVFEQQAKKYGITVPDQQVATSLAQIPAFQDKGTFSPQLYGRALQMQLHATPQEFEAEQRQAIAFYKLRWMIESCVKVTDQEAQMAYAMAHNGKLTGFEKDRAAFVDKQRQEKVVWSLNQWFTQLSQHTPIKAHLENIEGFK